MIPTVSSGLLTGNTQVYTGLCSLTGVQAITDGTNTVTVKIYDGFTDLDKQVAHFVVVGADYTGGRTFNHLKMEKGIYLTLSGTGGRAIVDHTDKTVL